MSNCLSCSRYSKCHDPKKSFSYSCEKYLPHSSDALADVLKKARKQTESDSAWDSYKNKASAEVSESKAKAERYEVRQFVKNLQKQERSGLVPKDMKIDDGDFPLAANFFEFTTSGKFLDRGFRPFPKQIESAMWLLTDFCPVCSDMDYARRIPVDADYDEIKYHVKFYKHGRCKRCGGNRTKAWKKGLIKRYDEAAGLVGQRCISGDSLVATTDGFKRIKSLCPLKEDVVSYYGPALINEDGIAVHPSHAMKIAPEPLVRLLTKSGFEIKGTKDHPIMTDKGWVTLNNMTAEKKIPIVYGQNVWGNRDIQDVVRLLKLPSTLSNMNKAKLAARAAANLLYCSTVDSIQNGVNTTLKVKRAFAAYPEIEKTFLDVGWAATYDIKTNEVLLHSATANDTTAFVVMTGNQIRTDNMQRSIPAFILSAAPYIVWEFISQVLRTASLKIKKPLNNLGFELPNHTVAREIQILLANFGVLVHRVGKLIYVWRESVEEYRRLNDGILPAPNVRTMFQGIYKINRDMPSESTYDFTIPKYHRFMANSLLNHNSGKSLWSSLVAGYHVHRFLKLQDPPRVFGLMPNQTLRATFVATLFRTAKANIYGPFHDLIQDSPWYKGYHEMLNSFGRKRGDEIFKFKDTFFEYKHRHLAGYVASPDQRMLRGDTRFLTVIDEIGHLYSKSKDSVKMNAKEIYTSLKRSMLTLRSASKLLNMQGHYDIPAPITLAISSPSSIHDMICYLYDRSKKENSSIYGFRYTSLEFNPTLDEETLKEEAGDAVTYARDYLARPPMSVNAFINKKKALLECVSDSAENIIEVGQTIDYTKTGIKITAGHLHINEMSNYIKAVPKMLTLDAGRNKNSFVGMLWYLKDVEDENRVPGQEPQKIPVVCGAFEVIPEHEAPINFTQLEAEVIYPICQELNVRFVAADQWQSEKLLSDLEEGIGCEYTVYSPKYDDFLQARSRLYNGDVELPAPEIPIKQSFKISKNEARYPLNFGGKPIAHFMLQALTVVDVPGKTVEKAMMLTDDLFRVFVLGSALIDEQEVVDILNAPDTAPSMGYKSDIGLATSGSGGGMGQMGGGIGSMEGMLVLSMSNKSGGGGMPGGSFGGNTGGQGAVVVSGNKTGG